jgi:tetratricopeptide (TPR) repeat protein
VAVLNRTVLHLLSDDDFIWPFVGAARFYDSQGRYAAAEPWYAECLATAEQRLGANHPDTVSSLNNLAYLYESIDRSEEALPLYARAVEICDRVLGLEHPTTVAIRENYEICLGSQTDD